MLDLDGYWMMLSRAEHIRVLLFVKALGVAGGCQSEMGNIYANDNVTKHKHTVE